MTAKVKRKKHQRSWRRGLVTRARLIVAVAILVFLFGAAVVGEIFGAYGTIWWWDDVMHTLAGLLLGLIGMLMIYYLNARHSLRLNPLLVAVFAFAFAISLLVLWEFAEFTSDALFHSDAQHWRALASDSVQIGHSYQGSGLRDTMEDLMVGWIGAMVAAVIAYLGFKHEKRTVLGFMRRVFRRRSSNKNK